MNDESAKNKHKKDIPMKKTSHADKFQEGAVGVVRIRNQKPNNPHCHTFTEVVLILSGEGIHYTRQKHIPIACGDVFVIPPGQVHDYFSTRHLRLVNLLIDQNKMPLPFLDLEDLPGFQYLFNVEPRLPLADSLPKRLSLSFEDILECDRMLAGIEAMMKTRAPGFRYQAAVEAYRVIYYICTHVSAEHPSMKSGYGRLAEILSRIASQPQQSYDLTRLAQESCLSQRSFRRIFQRITGMPPLRYINRMRIRLACELLKKPDLTIEEVANSVGFDDSNYFSRQFRKIMNMAPREYRQSLMPDSRFPSKTPHVNSQNMRNGAPLYSFADHFPGSGKNHGSAEK